MADLDSGTGDRGGVGEFARSRLHQKRDEYWTLGVKEYWIVDAKLKQVLVLRRGRSQWTEKTLGPADTCETKLLPGFKLPMQGGSSTRRGSVGRPE